MNGALVMAPTSLLGLSSQQIEILTWLYRRQRVEGNGHPLSNRVVIWGVPICGHGHTRSEQASISRAVARLEARGLILRQNEWTGPLRRSAADPHTRATNILVLEPGVKLAERLTKISPSKC